MKYFVYSLIFIFCSTKFARADYEAFKLTDMYEKSDVIVRAKIIGINDHSINCKVIKTFKGADYATIDIEKFKDWTCAQRYEKYAPGQEAIFFLKKSNKTNKFYVLSAGNEGELPIIDNIVYYQADSYGLGNEIIKQSVLKDTIHWQGRAFEYKNVDSVLSNYDNINFSIESKIDDSTIWSFKTQNTFLQILVEEKVFFAGIDISTIKLLQWQSDFYNLGLIIEEPEMEDN